MDDISPVVRAAVTKILRNPATSKREMTAAGLGLGMRAYRKLRDAHRLPGPRRPLARLVLRENDIRHRRYQKDASFTGFERAPFPGGFLRTWRRQTTKIFRDAVGNYVGTVRKTVVVTAAGHAWNKLDIGPEYADESAWVRCRVRCWSNSEHPLEYLAWAEEQIDG